MLCNSFFYLEGGREREVGRGRKGEGGREREGRVRGSSEIFDVYEDSKLGREGEGLLQGFFQIVEGILCGTGQIGRPSLSLGTLSSRGFKADSFGFDWKFQCS